METALMEARAAASLLDESGSLETPPPLFDQTNVRKPEYWQFAKLIAPTGALPPSKKQWTADDAIGIWCLRCQKSLVFQKGSSQSIRYHMETKHRGDLEAFRELGKVAGSSPLVRSKKRRHSADEVSMEGNDEDPEATTLAVDNAIQSPAIAAPSQGEWTWSRNLERRGGFWGNAQWYDLQLERRLPLSKPLVEEMIAALPPCDNRHVLDLCAGSGRATQALVAAYPTAFVTLVDASVERLGLARQRLRSLGHLLADEQFIPTHVSPATIATVSPLPVDVVIGCLALHVLAENPAHYATSHSVSPTVEAAPTKEAIYEQLLRGIFALLKPGGHFVFGDHVGQLPLFTQLQLLHRVGFIDVDCAWRQQDFFVAGGRKPMHLVS